jgi:hypothetical protein
MNTTTETKHEVCMPPTVLRRPRHRLFQDWQSVSRWIGANLHNRPRNALDLRPLLLPMAAMIATLALLGAVLPPWEEMRASRIIGAHYDETLPDGRTIKVTFVGWVNSVADLPATANVGDEIQVTDGGACWIRISNFEWVDP